MSSVVEQMDTEEHLLQTEPCSETFEPNLPGISGANGNLQEGSNDPPVLNDIYNLLKNGSVKIDLPIGWGQFIFDNAVTFTKLEHELTPSKRLNWHSLVMKEVSKEDFT